MEMREIVNSGAVVVPLGSNERDGVIGELLDRLIEVGAVDGDLRSTLLDRILDREAKGSTGFGRGVAIPHVKHDRIPDLSAAVGVSKEGVDFNALDKQPVFSIFLLVSPESEPETHLRAMEAIFSNLSKDAFRRFLRQSESSEDVLTLMADADNQRLPS